VIVRQGTDETPPAEGEAVHLTADPAEIHLFDADSEARVDT